MAKIKLVAIAALCCASTLAVAGGATTSPRFKVNIYGSVGVGTGAPVNVNQKGYANIAGVIQVAPRSTITVKQTGPFNGSGVGQLSSKIFSPALP